MRIALLHNPKAGNGTFRVSKFVRQIEKAGHKVVYASIKQNDWQDVFAEPVDRFQSIAAQIKPSRDCSVFSCQAIIKAQLSLE
jgi:ABC-type uncharacterized transport system substrate-binding protein